MHTITTDKYRRGHEYEGKYGRVCGRDWKEEKEERKGIIKIQCQKISSNQKTYQ